MEKNIDALKENAGTEVNRMLERLESRIEDKKPMLVVLDAIGKAKAHLDAHFDFKNGDAAKIKQFSNPWSAWAKSGVFEGNENRAQRVQLQALLKTELGQSARFARQVWRTEMVVYFAKKLKEAKREDGGKVMVEIMNAQIVKGLEGKPAAALRGAMRLDDKIEKKEVRDALAEKMKGGVEAKVAEIPEKFEGYAAERVRVVTGGDFVEVPLELTSAFEFKNMVLEKDQNRIYAQMKNGCEGNLVIIDVKKLEGKIVVPPVVPPPEPPIVPPEPPVVPPEPPVVPPEPPVKPPSELPPPEVPTAEGRVPGKLPPPEVPTAEGRIPGKLPEAEVPTAEGRIPGKLPPAEVPTAEGRIPGKLPPAEVPTAEGRVPG
ncbi:hypothetical protein COV82_06365, partial [Candidatus Peregrinibacteria bacterium CG11_big_fil_rev_8_21_14_0_20_46_8]